MATLWWKFSCGDAGNHLLRAKNLGAPGQEVWLDGAFLDAPAETTTFTGPAASLMEFQPSQDGGWTLLIDGSPAERYNPDTGTLESPAVVWWKFTLQGMGTHHLRVTNIGSADQAVFLDGTPLDAPVGTMTFTGPAASLLELQAREGRWVLVVDGLLVQQHNPHADPGGQLHLWSFTLPSTGAHQVQVANIGNDGQEIFLDGVQIHAPPSTTAFTGPEGVLLELQRRGNGWVLLVDGVVVEVGSGAIGPARASWTFLNPQTGSAHQMQVVNMGQPGQEVYLDGTLLPAPDGQTAFTGPGGALLELKSGGHAWSLFVDGVGVEDYNARSNTLMAAGAAGGALAEKRAAVDTGGFLPQGVSYDAETGSYKANIKVKGRFKFLGDFATPTEAHEKYLQAKKDLDGS